MFIQFYIYIFFYIIYNIKYIFLNFTFFFYFKNMCVYIYIYTLVYAIQHFHLRELSTGKEVVMCVCTGCHCSSVIFCVLVVQKMMANVLWKGSATHPKWKKNCASFGDFPQCLFSFLPCFTILALQSKSHFQ